MFRVSPTNQVMATWGTGPVTVIGGMYSNNSTVNHSMNGLVTGLFSEAFNGINTSAGVSYLSNVAGTNSGVGNAYSTSTSSTTLNGGNNGAYDVNFSVGIPLINVIGEYVSTVNSAYSNNVNVGIMSAWMLGTAGKFSALGTPYQWQVSYSQTQNMQNIPMPLDGDYQANLKSAVGFKNQWLGSLQGEFWQNVFIGPEVGYDTLYNSAGHTYTLTLDATAYF